MTQARATAEGYLWNHGGKVLEYILLFLSAVFIARGLGVEANGVYASLVSIAQLLMVLGSLGLDASLNRYIPQIRAAGGDASGPSLRFLLRRVFAARAMLLLAVVAVTWSVVLLLGQRIPGEIASYFWLLVGYTAVRSSAALVSVVFVAQLRTASLARITVAVRLIELAGIAGMSATGMALAPLMLFLISTGALQLGCTLFAARSDLAGKAEPFSLRPFYAFGAVYWANTIMEYFLGRQGDVLFLSMLLPTSVPASMYNVAYSVVLVAAQGMTLGLGGITLTSFSRLAVTSPEKMDRFYAFLVRFVSLLIVPVLVFIFFNADAIVTLAFSEKFLPAVPLVQGMIAFRLLTRLVAGAENSDYLLAKGEVGALVRIGIVGALANVLLDLYLIPGLLAFGAVVGSGCANLLVNLLRFLHIRKRAEGLAIQWKYWTMVTFSAVIAAAAATLILPGSGWLLLIVRGAVFIGLTGLLLFLTKPFPEIDCAWVSEVSQRFARMFMHFTRGVPATVARV